MLLNPVFLFFILGVLLITLAVYFMYGVASSLIFAGIFSILFSILLSTAE